MVAYQAETDLVRRIAPHYHRADDERRPGARARPPTDGYVCMTTRVPHGGDPRGGHAGALYISINDAPRCADTAIEDGYVYSMGATYSGSHWSPATLYSDAALTGLYRSLQHAGAKGVKVRLSGTNERPHAQIHAVTILGT
jgi:hypothetical protein